MAGVGQTSSLIGKVATSSEIFQRCIVLAGQGLGHVSPNPPVACVICDAQGVVIAEGFHKKFGQAHAEVDALNSLEDKNALQGATCYVTLEPCSFQGKTPSCAKTLATLPITKVIYAMEDPNPKVSGSGTKILQDQNIVTELWSLSSGEMGQLQELMASFVVNQLEKRAYVGMKVAASLDGQVALASGESQWITSEAARSRGHLLRGQHDGILFGAGTFLDDDPKMTVRHENYPNKKNRPILLDPKGKAVPRLASSQLLKNHDVEDVIYIGPPSPELPAEMGYISAPEDVSSFFEKSNLIQYLEILYSQYGIGNLLIEGGPGVYSAFVHANLVDRYHLFIGSKILGAQSGRSWTEKLSISSLKDSIQTKGLKVEPLDGDVYMTFYSSQSSQ